MSQEGFSILLQVSIRTVRRDIREIKKDGIDIVIIGYLHNIGRGQTYKVKIIGMYLDGMTYSDIKIRAKHTAGAIKRYIESFTKVVMAQRKGIYRAKDISAVTGLSDGLIKQYLELLKESKKDKIRRENLRLPIERNSSRDNIKNCKEALRASDSYDGRFIMI